MGCKHRRIITKLVLIQQLPQANAIITEQYEEKYFCSHCGKMMVVNEA